MSTTRKFNSLFDKIASIGETPLTSTQLARAKKKIERKFDSAIESVEEAMENASTRMENALRSTDPDFNEVVSAAKEIAALSGTTVGAVLKETKKAFLSTEVEVEVEPILVKQVD